MARTCKARCDEPVEHKLVSTRTIHPPPLEEIRYATRYNLTEAAHRASKTMTEAPRTNMRKLEAVMAKHGFEPFPFEWWHFDFKGWKSYPVLDISFDELAAGKTMAEGVD